MTQGIQVPFTPSARVPDERVQVLDDAFLSLRLASASVEQLGTGFYWAEGPQWIGDGRFLLFSDVPNNRIMRWDEITGSIGEYRVPSNHANGLARDREGRLLTCEHLTRRVTRTEHDGRITVLADRFDGKRLNSPNDIVCQRNGDVWFTDPPFGILSAWEGEPATPELPHGVYRIDAVTGDLHMLLDDLQGSNGLAFSPDESKLYVVESRSKPNRKIWQYDVKRDEAAGAQRGKGAQVKLVNKQLFVDAEGPGAYDGMAVDVHGNVWCGFGSSGPASIEGLDGVRVYNPSGKPLAHIHLPERCANVCFGGAKNNRLFMASTHSLYALYVNTHGAVR